MHKQLFMPGFPDGAQRIGEAVSIVEKDGWVSYFVGSDNYFRPPCVNMTCNAAITVIREQSSHEQLKADLAKTDTLAEAAPSQGARRATEDGAASARVSVLARSALSCS